MSRNLMAAAFWVAGQALVCGTAGAFETSPSAESPPSVERVLLREAQATDAVLDRRELLTETLEQNPESKTARWQAGFVRESGMWRPFEEIDDRSERRLAEYRTLRASTAQTAKDQLQLANWCAKHGLEEQERAHLTAALALSEDADLPQVRARLGYRLVNGRWMTREEQEEALLFAREAEQSMKRWGRRLQNIAERLAGSRRQRESATAELSAIDDPGVLVAAEVVLTRANESAGLEAVELFSRFRRYEASLALARQAAFSQWPSVRGTATEALKSRRWDDFIPPLLTAMHRPAESMFRVLIGGRGEIYYTYVCAREMADHWQVARYRVENFLFTARRSRRLPTVQRARSDAARAVADEAYAREAVVARHNEQTQALNERVGGVLAAVTGQEQGSDPAEWWNWWIHRTDSEPRAKRVLIVNEEERIGSPPPPACECLAAGTSIWTDRGLVPVEDVQIGDRVLSKEIDSGELAYKPVVFTTVRVAPNTMRLSVGDEMIELTAGHPVWVSGAGWTRAQELQSGIPLHTVTGTVAVDLVEPLGSGTVYNLVVADFHTYFFGEAKILSHDPTTAKLTNAIVPGLAADAAGRE